MTWYLPSYFNCSHFKFHFSLTCYLFYFQLTFCPRRLSWSGTRTATPPADGLFSWTRCKSSSIGSRRQKKVNMTSCAYWRVPRVSHDFLGFVFVFAALALVSFLLHFVISLRRLRIQANARSTAPWATPPSGRRPASPWTPGFSRRTRPERG